MSAAIKIGHRSEGEPPQVIQLHPDGTLTTVDGSSVQERLAELYRLWNSHPAAKLEGPQFVNVVHQKHLRALWSDSNIIRSFGA